MRILLLNHFPLDSPWGPWVQRCNQALSQAGNSTRLLAVVSSVPAASAAEPAVRRVACSAADLAADLPFDLPCFRNVALVGCSMMFDQLTDQQLQQYRQCLRTALDAEIDAFDPHVIHVQHLWILAQLALETGVPYVVNAWGEELDELHDLRLAALADQAAENASRILVFSQAVAARLASRYESIDEQIELLDPALLNAAPLEALATYLQGQYQRVYQARFGRPI